MHIVYTTKIYLPHIGGVELYIKNLSDYFVSLGNQVTVITADEESDRLSIEFDSGIKVMRIPARSISGILLLKNIKDFAEIKKEISTADILHVNDCKFLFDYFARKKSQYHYKLICSSHGWLFHTNDHAFIKKLYFKFIVKGNSNKYDRIICVSNQDRRIAESYGIRCDKVILPGANIKKYSDIPKETENKNIFFYWGRIAENKGILEALQKLSELTNDYEFNIAGKCSSGTYMSVLKKFIQTHNMNKKIHFLGLLSDEDIKQRITECDFILLPSLHEGFGITLIECILSGRAIIANTNESFTDILLSCDAKGYLFNFEDKKTSLEEKIRLLSREKIVPKNVGQFSIETTIQQIQNLYEAL